MNTDRYASQLLKEREAAQEAGDLLARAAVETLKVTPCAALAAATFAYMKKEACVDAKFFAEMSAKERMVVALIGFLRGTHRLPGAPRGRVYR